MDRNRVWIPYGILNGEQNINMFYSPNFFFYKFISMIDEAYRLIQSINHINGTVYGHNENIMVTLTNTSETAEERVIKMLKEGPAVSLKGSPTVSPITAALCCSLPLPL